MSLMMVSTPLASQAADGIPFVYSAGHVMVIPVRVCNRGSFFIFDTGAGINIVSEKLAEKLGCRPIGRHSGRRMSGQRLTMEMINVGSLQVGSCVQKNVPAGIWHLEELLAGEPELAHIEGFVSLEYFKNTPFTIDYKKKRIFIEDDTTLQQRLDAGKSVRIRVIHEHRIDTGVTLPLVFSNGKSAKVEVDTGSGGLILNERYMNYFGISKKGAGTKTVNGKDETGHSYVRYFSEVPVDVFVSGAPKLRLEKPRVQFQKIIYDGVVGDSFLRNFIVTYDLPHKRMIFAPTVE